MIKVEGKDKIYIIFSLLGTVVVLWQLLLPGYVMTLDYVTGPVNIFPDMGGVVLSNFVFKMIMYFVSAIFGTMLAQKFFLLGLFFCMFFFPFIYFPFEVREKYKYFASLFFVLNPFVLERFLAGQAGVLAGYVCLFPFLYYLANFLRTSTLKNFQKVLLASFVVAVFSFHIFIMVCVINFLTIIFAFAQMLVTGEIKYDRKNIWSAVETGTMFLLLNLYWLYPVFSHSSGSVYTFDSTNVAAFQTGVLGTGILSYLGIFTLQGFWGERELWATQFGILAFQNIIFFIPLFFTICLGMYLTLKKEKKLGLFLFFTLLLSSVFSLGVGESFVKTINQFLFDHIFFWSGFRDSQKWSAVLAVLMSIYLALGVESFTDKIKNVFIKSFFKIFVVALIILYSYKILFGFNGMLQNVVYPESWYEVNKILKNDKSCTAVYLPWHMYYFLPVNNGLLTASPAAKFFDCHVYTSLDPEFHSIGNNSQTTEIDIKIQEIMDNKNMSYDEKVEKLARLSVRYIIETGDTKNEELGILDGNEKVIHIYDSKEIILYKIVDKL